MTVDPYSTYGRRSISTSMNQEGIGLEALTCTLGDCCMNIEGNDYHTFIDNL